MKRQKTVCLRIVVISLWFSIKSLFILDEDMNFKNVKQVPNI